MLVMLRLVPHLTGPNNFLMSLGALRTPSLRLTAIASGYLQSEPLRTCFRGQLGAFLRMYVSTGYLKTNHKKEKEAKKTPKRM